MAPQSTIVTGAGSGIGRAIALALAARGHRMLLVGRTEGKLAETAALCRAQAPDCEPTVVAGDLADPAFAAAIVDQAIAAFGHLDTLVNCAGVAPLAPIDRTTHAMLVDAFAQNAYAPAVAIARAWPHFSSRRAGCIVNVSSMASLDPFPGFFAYAASKSALDSFTRSAHNEGAKLGIRAFCVNPGAVETPMLRKSFPISVLPAASALAPEDVAAIVVDCIEGRREESRGKTIPVRREPAARA